MLQAFSLLFSPFFLSLSLFLPLYASTFPHFPQNETNARKKIRAQTQTPLGTIGHRVEVRSVEADQEHAPDVNGAVADEPGDDVVRVDSGKDKGE